jgi:L-alanine-DL-glutamate epimerase-like enolase superfamily enzyme
VFVKVYTDEGITGVGEGTLEYKEKALVGAIEHIKDYLVGTFDSLSANDLQLENKIIPELYREIKGEY